MHDDDLPADWQDTLEIPLLGDGTGPTVPIEPLPRTVALVPFPPPPTATTGTLPSPWVAPPLGTLIAIPPAERVAPVGYLPAPWAPGPTTLVLTDRQEPSAALLVSAWVLAVLTLGYLLPWAVAATRGRSNHGGIAVVNVLLGWTLVGWAVALVMACSAHRPVLVQVFAAPAQVRAVSW